MEMATTIPARAQTGSRRRDLLLGVGVGALVLAVVVLLGLRLGNFAQSGPTVLRVGKPAPEFTLASMDGGTISLSDLKGKPTWLNVWATWCAPCRAEMPDLQQVHESGGKDQYNLVAMNLGEDAATVERFLKELGYTLPVALDETGEVTLRYRVMGLPTHFFIDGNGILVETYVGVLTRQEMERRVAALW